jgi:hypothetical protein
MPVALREHLGADPVLPMTEIPRGPLAGQLAVDETALRNKLAHGRLNARLRNHALETGSPADAETFKQWELEEVNRARYEVAAMRRDLMSKGPGLAGNPTPWVDTDTDTHEAFRRWVKEGGPTGSKLLDWNPFARSELVRKASAPFAAATMGSKHEVFREGADGLPETVTYNDDDAWGFLDWSGRMSPLTMLATTLKASGEQSIWQTLNPTKWDDYVRTWGSEEHLKLIQQGQDIFSLADDLDLDSVDPFVGDTISTVLQAAGVVSEEQAQGIDDAAGAFLLSLFDPDVFTLATAGAAKAPTSVRKAAKATVDVLPGARKLESAPGAIMEAIRGGDIYGTNLVGLAEKSKVLREAHDAFKTISEAGMSPEAAQTAVYEVLNKLDETAPQLSVMLHRVAATMTGENTPIPTGVFRARKNAAAAQRAVNEEFGTAAEAVRESTETAQDLSSKGGTTRYWERARTEADLKRPEVKTALEEAEAKAKSWRARYTAVKEVEDAALKDLQAAQAALKKASAEAAKKAKKAPKASAELRAAEQAFAKATKALREATDGGKRELSKKATAKLSAAVTKAETRLEAAQAAAEKAKKAATAGQDKALKGLQAKVDEAQKAWEFAQREAKMVGAGASQAADELAAANLKYQSMVPSGAKKAAQTRRLKSRAHKTAEHKAAKLDNLAQEMFLGGLKAQHAALRRLAQGGKVALKASTDADVDRYMVPTPSRTRRCSRRPWASPGCTRTRPWPSSRRPSPRRKP